MGVYILKTLLNWFSKEIVYLMSSQTNQAKFLSYNRKIMIYKGLKNNKLYVIER